MRIVKPVKSVEWRGEVSEQSERSESRSEK